MIVVQMIGPRASSPGGSPRPEVPGYEIGELLGQGGMGAVFSAHELATDREVAIKWIPSTVSARLRQRFEREARAAARTRHPNIVTIYGAGEAPRGFYIAMELVRGVPLSEALESRRLGRNALAYVLAKVARGLAAAHESGLVHRDVKPANILLDDAQEPRILDFGVARFTDEDSQLTGPNAILGTFAYMSPE